MDYVQNGYYEGLRYIYYVRSWQALCEKDLKIICDKTHKKYFPGDYVLLRGNSHPTKHCRPRKTHNNRSNYTTTAHSPGV